MDASRMNNGSSDRRASKDTEEDRGLSLDPLHFFTKVALKCILKKDNFCWGCGLSSPPTVLVVAVHAFNGHCLGFGNVGTGHLVCPFVSVFTCLWMTIS